MAVSSRFLPSDRLDMAAGELVDLATFRRLAALTGIPCSFPDPAFQFPVPPGREFARKR